MAPGFQREFVELPAEEADDAAPLRDALGVRVEDLGGLAAAPVPLCTFEELDVFPEYALQGLRDNGIETPMPIQAQALPMVLGGCNLIGLAQTGSGKTLAFLLPAVVHIEAQKATSWTPVTPIALVLAPTRELAVQISDEAAKILSGSEGATHKHGIRACSAYGGGKRHEQLKNLQWGAHILVATPGRLIDFVEAGDVSLSRVTYFVLDEADRMLDLGFSGDVATISARVRPERQVLFFSATWSETVQKFAKKLCHQGATPVRIAVGQSRCEDDVDGDAHARLAREGIEQQVIVIDFPDDEERQEQEKRRILDEHLHAVLSDEAGENKVLVFVSQKTHADELAAKLWEAGFEAAAMHGGKSQDSRLWTLQQFRDGKLRMLVATDVIGRGIDIPSVSHVVVYDMGTIDDYVHRIGRTARGVDASGHALVFFEFWHKEPGIAAQLIQLLRASEQEVPEDLVRIAEEVESGTRPRSGKRKSEDWGDGSWNGGGGWKSKGSWGGWEKGAAAKWSGDDAADAGGASPWKKPRVAKAVPQAWAEEEEEEAWPEEEGDWEADGAEEWSEEAAWDDSAEVAAQPWGAVAVPFLRPKVRRIIPPTVAAQGGKQLYHRLRNGIARAAGLAPGLL